MKTIALQDVDKHADFILKDITNNKDIYLLTKDNESCAYVVPVEILNLLLNIIKLSPQCAELESILKKYSIPVNVEGSL